MKATYIKLYFAAVAAAAIISVLLISLFFVRLQERRMAHVNPRESGMVRFLVREIEETPTQETVDRLAENFRLHIRVESPGMTLQSDKDFFQSPRYLSLKRRGSGPVGGRRDRRMRDVRLLVQEQDPVGFELRLNQKLYTFVRNTEPGRAMRIGIMVALLVLLVLGVLGFLVKRWLGDPLRELERSIRQFSGTESGESPPKASGELKRLFDAFSDMKQQVRETLADKERLMRDVSHDLKSPITRLRVAVELIPEGKARNRMMKDLDELTDLVNKVLDSQHIEGQETEELDMRELVDDFLQRHEPAMPVSVDVREQFRFAGNRGQLHRVLRNLVDNSWKYADRSAGLRIVLDRDAHGGILRVIDTGPEIPSHVIERMFEPFYKRDDARRQDIANGSGLGLAICRRILQTMEATIQAGPAEGGGLEIDIRFPLLPEDN